MKIPNQTMVMSKKIPSHESDPDGLYSVISSVHNISWDTIIQCQIHIFFSLRLPKKLFPDSHTLARRFSSSTLILPVVETNIIFIIFSNIMNAKPFVLLDKDQTNFEKPHTYTLQKN